MTQAFVPRAWQLEARKAWDAHPCGGKGALVVAATGAGKTALGHFLLEPHLERGERVLWLAHRTELVEQPLKTLRRWWPQYKGGIVQASKDECAAQVVYASKDTVRNPKRLERILSHGHPSVIVADEAHYSLAKTWVDLLNKLHGPTTKLLGLTATPDRGDNKRMSDRWDLVFSYPILDAIADGVLVPPFAVVDLLEEMNLDDIKQTAGDYDQEELASELIRAKVVEHTVEAMTKVYRCERLPIRDEMATMEVGGSSVVVFTVTVAQAQLTTEALRAAGFTAETVWGGMTKWDRARVLREYEAGRVQVLCNADLLTVGWDSPKTKVGIFAKPTRAWSRFVQIAGRMLRPNGEEDKALIIDLVGVTRELSIVGAPVLVDGVDCDVSHDGKHRYLQVEGTQEGRCQDCGLFIKCFRSLGGHKFKDGKCKHCGALQCPDSPDLFHHWVPWEDAKRVCIYCAVEIPDPMAALVNRSASKSEPVAWKKLAVPGQVYAANLGGLGTLYNVQHGELFLPWLYTRDSLKPLAPRPVDPRMSRLLTDDVARRSAKTKGFYGAHGSKGGMRRACMDAEKIAKYYSIWEKR